jgi:peroxiredoxin
MLRARATLTVRSMAGTDTTEQRPLLRGAKAPGFKLRSTPDQFVELADFRGRPVLLVFYPADWSPVCSDQLVVYQEIMPAFAKYDAQVLGISVDGAWCHAAFSKNRNLRFPLLADFEPKGEVARAYGVYRPGDGFSERALILVDGVGEVFWSYVSPVGVNPGADGALRALQRMAESRAANTAAA